MSTKTTLKRIALVAVSALGFGVLTSVAPATAANTYTASFTAPSGQAIQTVSATDLSVTARDLGSVVTTLSAGAGDTLNPGADTITVTIAAQTASGGIDAAADTAQQAKNDALVAKLSFDTYASVVTPLATATASAANYYNFATTGQNAINNATVSTTTTTMLTSPTSAVFSSAVGRAYVKLAALTGAQATSASGGVVTFAVTTVAGNGTVSTFTQTMSITFGVRLAGVATVGTTTGTIAAGGTATFTVVSPYTAVRANDSWLERNLTLAGSAVGSTFSATAVATGGAITLARIDANTISATALKSNIAGAYSVTYTIVVTAAATAAAGSTIIAGGFTVTVQPYTPVYNSSTLIPSQEAAGYYAAASAGGDGIAYGYASNVTGIVFSVGVQQKDQNGANITSAAYAKTLGAVITGKGSLAAPSGANVVVKETAETALNTLLSGNDTVNVYSDGTSGEGKLEVSVNGVVVGTYTLRFLGDAVKVTAALVYPVGNAAGATTGGAGGATVGANNLAAGSVVASVTATSDPAIAVSVLDVNGFAIPTTAPIVTSSKVGVVSGATRLFIDAGVSDPSTLKYSAGTFVQHFSYTTLASASGSTSDVTFTFVNTAGTALVSPAVKVTVGGAVAKTTLAFDKATYNPGEIAKLTATATDASGNKAYDGQDVNLNIATTTLFATIGSMIIVDGVKEREIYAPMASGTWTVTLYDVADRTATATATVRNPADEAKAAANAATAASEAATDAAAEAIDAANAATDAANLAAEAADAATVAAEEARDAADAATAAVEELATQVATLMAALKAQITTLANTIAKIAKKVKA